METAAPHNIPLSRVQRTNSFLSPKAQAFCNKYAVDMMHLQKDVVVIREIWTEPLSFSGVLKLLGLPDTALIIFLPKKPGEGDLI